MQKTIWVRVVTWFKRGTDPWGTPEARLPPIPPNEWGPASVRSTPNNVPIIRYYNNHCCPMQIYGQTEASAATETATSENIYVMQLSSSSLKCWQGLWFAYRLHDRHHNA